MITRIALSITLAMLPLALSAQTNMSGMVHTPGMTQPPERAAIPTQPGQGAFAALAEIVAMLRADPASDWNRVNIDALRAHLVDMDMLVTRAAVTSTEIEGGLRMTISRTEDSGAAVNAMVPAHAPVLAAETGWNSTVTDSDSGDSLIWAVTSPSDAPIIRALGFFGLMATGAHHPAHHLALATGKAMR